MQQLKFLIQESRSNGMMIMQPIKKIGARRARLWIVVVFFLPRYSRGLRDTDSVFLPSWRRRQASCHLNVREDERSRTHPCAKRKRDAGWSLGGIAVPPGSIRRRRVRPNVVEDGWTAHPITMASNLPSAAQLLRDREFDAVETRWRACFSTSHLPFFLARDKTKKAIVSKLFC